MVRVYIVILNWNRKEETLACLESLEGLKVSGFELKIIIVDNASSDNSVSAFVKFKSKFEVEIIENKKNLGYAMGNNVGIEYALNDKSDFILILNNDTQVSPSLVLNLLQSARNNPKAGAFSPKIYFAKGYEFHKSRYKKDELGEVVWSAGGGIDWANVFGKNDGIDEVDKGQFDIEKEIEFATGACVMYRAQALKEVGKFNSSYFMYFEDVDLSLRLKKGGWGIFYVPTAVLWHKVAQSSGSGSGLNDYFIARNRMFFGMKYAPLRAKFALLRESIRIFLSGRLWQKKGIRDFYMGKFGKGSWK